MEDKKPAMKTAQPKREYKNTCSAPKDISSLADVRKGILESHNKTRCAVRAYSNDFIMMKDSGQ